MTTPSEDQTCWALMRDHFRRCTRKGVLDPITKQQIKCEGCVDRREKDEGYRNQMFINGHTKEELQSWDAQMKAGMQNTVSHVNYVNRYMREG